jgi:hypothetical protein
MKSSIMIGLLVAFGVATSACADDATQTVLSIFKKTCAASSQPDTLEAIDRLARGEGLWSEFGARKLENGPAYQQWQFREGGLEHLLLLVSIEPPQGKDRLYRCGVNAPGGDPQELIDGLKKLAGLGDPDRVDNPDAENRSIVRSIWNVTPGQQSVQYLLRYNPGPSKPFVALTLAKALANPERN